MQCFTGKGFGRVFLLKLERGENLLESVCTVIERENIKYGVIVSGVATLEHASFHRIRNCNEIPEDEMIEMDGPYEVSSLQGAIINGEPHIHMTFSDLEETRAVHLEPGSVVLYTAEVMIAEISGFKNIKRSKNEKGIPIFLTDEN